MTRLYGYRQAQTAAYRAIRERMGWDNLPQYRQWECPHALLALELQPEHKVLSVGAHWCELTVALCPRCHLSAMDIAPAFKPWAKVRLEGAEHVWVGDARHLPYGDASFDRVVAVSMLEHVSPPEDGDVQVMHEIGRVLRPGGRAVVTVEASREFVPWRLPVGRSYDWQAAYDRLVKPSGLSLDGRAEYSVERLQAAWHDGDWGDVWPEAPWELIPACLVFEGR